MGGWQPGCACMECRWAMVCSGTSPCLPACVPTHAQRAPARAAALPQYSCLPAPTLTPLPSRPHCRYERGKLLLFVSSQDRCDTLFRDLLRAGYPCLRCAELCASAALCASAGHCCWLLAGRVPAGAGLSAAAAAACVPAHPCGDLHPRAETPTPAHCCRHTCRPSAPTAHPPPPACLTQQQPARRQGPERP